jgi:hypothetical protein
MERLFDVEPAGLKLFLENVRKKAVSFNWMRTFNIPVNGHTLSLIDSYGAITMPDVRQQALTYIGQHVRHAQNLLQIFNCLSASLTEGGMARVYLHSVVDYTVNGITDGILFLKLIIRLAHINTRATVTVICTRLSSLDSKIAYLQDDIVACNKYVRLQRLSLEARGERTLDLLVNLFKGYKAVADTNKFATYIGTKEDSYNEGIYISENELMDLAKSKYLIMLENGEWKTQTMEQKKIVALTQQVQSLQNHHKPAPEKKQGIKTEGGGHKDTVKGKTLWYFVGPAEGGPKTKEHNGKKYHWCLNHGEKGKWVIHTPEECNAGNKDSGGKSKKTPGKLQVAGYSSVTEHDDEESDGDF